MTLSMFFEVEAWGPPVGEGVSDARFCTMNGVAKVNSEAFPFTVANEYISGRLALIIGLPAPPGVIVQTDDDRLAYVSLRFGHRGERPPPVIPEHLVEDNPVTAAGIVAFDCWIGNGDRHQRNLAYVRDVAPITIFDHGHALLGTVRPDVVDRLRRDAATPVVAGCLAPLVSDVAQLRDWSDKIRTVPENAVRETCNAVLHPAGLTADEAGACADYLLYRRGRIMEMLVNRAAALPRIRQWELGLQ